MKKVLLLSSITAVCCLCAAGCMLLEVDSLEVCERPFPGLPVQYSYLIVPDTTVYEFTAGTRSRSADPASPLLTAAPSDTINAARSCERRLVPCVQRQVSRERSSGALRSVVSEKQKAHAALVRSGFPGRTCFFSFYEWLLLMLIVLLCAVMIRIGLMKSEEIVLPRR